LSARYRPLHVRRSVPSRRSSDLRPRPRDRQGPGPRRPRSPLTPPAPRGPRHPAEGHAHVWQPNTHVVQWCHQVRETVPTTTARRHTMNAQPTTHDDALIAALDASPDFTTVTDGAHLAELLGVQVPSDATLAVLNTP